MPNFHYDEFLAEFQKARASVGEPSWVIARDLESAEAFASWCVENDIEEPEIAVIKLKTLP
jgi:hypothetical protein